MKRASAYQFQWVVAVLLLWTVVGCTPSESESPSETNTQSDRAAGDQVATLESAVDSRLLGVWLGTATIDQQRLQSLLESMSQQERDRLQPIVDSYLSTIMAMQFDEQGTVENDVEMKLEGRTVRESSVGVYRIVGRTESSVEIEVREQLEDGTQLTTRKTIWLDPGGRRMEFDVPLGESLEGVGARLVFERQMLESVASESQPSGESDVRR